jgi:hypothetical protein
MRRLMDHEVELRALSDDFAAVAQDRFDVRWTGAAMEEVFSRLAQCRGDALSSESARELKHAK